MKYTCTSCKKGLQTGNIYLLCPSCNEKIATMDEQFPMMRFAEWFAEETNHRIDADLLKFASNSLKSLERAEQTIRNVAANLPPGDLKTIAFNESVNLSRDIIDTMRAIAKVTCQPLDTGG